MGLSQISGLGAQTFCALLHAFGSPEAVWSASYAQLTNLVGQRIASEISAGLVPETVSPTLEWLTVSGNALVTLADSAYPRALLEISDPPPILYAKGNLALLNSLSIAVVGSRNATPQGEKNAEDFSRSLSEHGVCVVSGMALGIDGAAHRGALKGRGSTIAVVGTGLDIVYPARHRALAHDIVEHGLMVSEFGLGTPSKAQNFPRRNRIISGLAKGCLVVEANLQSGSLITARLAAEQGREVFAIPGSIHSPVAKGCHQLIKDGAKLVDNINDILDELGATYKELQQSESDVFQAELASECADLLAVMGFEPISVDQIMQLSGLTSDILSAMLLTLELDGKIVSMPGGRYQRLT